MGLVIRPARAEDVAEIRALIVELCEYEREPPETVKASVADLHDALFGSRPAGEALIAEIDGEVAGQALFYETFSTWEGKAGIWLEDLFVRPSYRGTGAGAALFRALAQLCLERGLTRYEWVALDWNVPALDFYGRMGARRLDEWKLHRLDGDALARVAGEA